MLDKSIVDVDPNPISFAGAFANCKAVVARASDVVLKKVSDFGAVFGMNAVHCAAALKGDKFFLGALDHFQKFTRTPHGKIFSVGLDAHENGIVVQ